LHDRWENAFLGSWNAAAGAFFSVGKRISSVGALPLTFFCVKTLFGSWNVAAGAFFMENQRYFET
jgi:hypothetical protein